MRLNRLTENRWGLELYNQWTAILRSLFAGDKYNWYDFTLIEITFEKCNITGRYQFNLSLIGFCMSVQYVYDQTFNEQASKIMDEFDREIREGKDG